jgi:hypothetical protein
LRRNSPPRSMCPHLPAAASVCAPTPVDIVQYRA